MEKHIDIIGINQLLIENNNDLKKLYVNIYGVEYFSGQQRAF
jgi:hypothetical protein